MNCYSAITGMPPVRIFGSSFSILNQPLARSHAIENMNCFVTFKQFCRLKQLRLTFSSVSNSKKLVPKMTRQSCLSSCKFPLVLVNLFVSELFLGRQCPTYQQVRSCKVVAKCLTADISGRDLSDLRQCFASWDIFFFFFFHFSFESQKRIE